MQFLKKFRQFPELKEWTLFLASLGGILINFLWFHNPFIGGFSILLFLFYLSTWSGRVFFPDFPKIPQILWGAMVTFSEMILIGTLFYYFYKITPLIAMVTLLIPAFITTLFACFRTKIIENKKEKIFSKISQKALILAIGVVLFDLILLAYLFSHQTMDLAASPWQKTSPLFFLVFLFSTSLLFWFYTVQKNNPLIYILTSLHVFVFYGVSSILYPLGYGFDAFVHRATEQWIFDHGFITPKTPYYIGQYSLVTIFSHLSSIPLKWIDIFLVPVLSAVMLPGMVIFSFQKSFSKFESLAPFLFWLVPFLPFLNLWLTTPHNIVIFITLATIFSLVLGVIKKFPTPILFLFAGAGIATHALVGVPLFVVIFFFFIATHLGIWKQKKFLIILLILSLALLLPTLFTLNGLRAHTQLPELHNPLEKLPEFLQIFQRPYWYAKTSPIYFEILYAFERMILPLFFILSIFGIAKVEKENIRQPFWIFLTSFFGFFISGFTLAGTIVFPDVVAYEQKDYPLRLLKTSVLFLLPLAMVGAGFLAQKIQEHAWIKKNKKKILFVTLCGLGVILTLIFYLSYPQRNPKARFPGFNVTISDQKAVQWIHEQHSDYSYIVLSNQLVSAAALEQYSFAKYFDTSHGQLFYYSIPTGGLLYQYYGKMIYEGQKREYMEEAMQKAGVQTAYFVVNTYWANSNSIIEGAKKSSDSVHVIDDAVWIFEYTFK